MRAGFPPGMLVSIAMWVLFSIYWEAAAKNASQATRSESKISRGFHLILISLAQLLIFFPIPGLRARFMPASSLLVVVSLLVQVQFFALAIWARRLLGKHWSGAVTAKVGHELIQAGPYRVVRHPIYTAILGVYGTTALISGEIHGVIGFVIACLAYWRKIRMEEAYLGEQFGPAYAKYQSVTKAIVPGLL
jgi:protein-S-isoprenylcysteine O-methyltransferase Ste14